MSWRAGWITNISGSGILFRAEQTLELETRIELTFALKPAGTWSGEPPATVFCVGHIVRVEGRHNGHPGSVLAAAIRTHRFQRDPYPA